MRSVHRLVAVLTLPAIAALAACGSTSDDAAASGAKDSTIVVEHAYGTTELENAPERVVTLGLLETDVAVALGVTPMAMAKFFAGPDGVAPWLAPELEQTPEILDTTTTGANGATLNVERIAELEPDLIIANTYSQLGKYYDQLSDIAPVLGPADANYLRLPWREQTAAIAQALGKGDQAASLINKVDNDLAEAVTRYPQLAGHDYTLSLGTPDQMKVMNDPADASVEVLGAFGLTFSEAASALPGLEDGSGSAGVSPETVEVIDADVVMVGYFGTDAQATWEQSPIFGRLPAVTDGRYLAMDLSDSTALRNPSPLSIGYVVDGVVAQRIAPALSR